MYPNCKPKNEAVCPSSAAAHCYPPPFALFLAGCMRPLPMLDILKGRPKGARSPAETKGWLEPWRAMPSSQKPDHL